MQMRISSYSRNPLICLLKAFLLILIWTTSISFAQEAKTLAEPLLPKPTGQYAVGTSIFHLTDFSRKYAFAPESGRHREMMVQIWYPAKKMKQASTVSYFPDPTLISKLKKEEYLDLKPEVIESWNTKTYSARDAPIIQKPRRLSLLIFSHGFGMSRSNYTSILENLASRGYIIAAIDHPYMGFTVMPDGRTLSFT